MTAQVVGYQRTQNGITFETVPAADVLTAMHHAGFKDPALCMRDLDSGLERRAGGFNYKAIIIETGPRISRRDARQQKREFHKQFFVEEEA